ncbi:hypothetical protein BGZ63DRAFT_399846 [Mariannaea sp. PMI_226]|nr:hypothetical protein BGZ63DRAFT_399846 [Mariannaea sp. PMI_226]
MVATRASSRAASAIPEDSPRAAESSSSPSPSPEPPASPSTPRRRTNAKQPATATKKRTVRASKSPKNSSSKDAAVGWSHTPTPLTLLWLCVSVPLVIWDTVYMLGRPHTFEGGSIHWPLWVPYQLYAKIDYVYSPKAWDAHDGFSGAQSALNAVETVMYLFYMYSFFTAPAVGSNARKALSGRAGAFALLVGFGAALMTLSKTVLYFAHEYYSGFANIGHNSTQDLITLWIIPNGPWIVVSAYMVWAFGKDILDGLDMASGHAKKN